MRTKRRMRRLAAALLVVAPLALPACQQGAPTGPTPLAESDGVAESHVGGDKSGITLIDVVAGATGTSNNYPGQSVIIPGTGAYNHLQFNWYNSAGQPVAFGRVFILTQEYLGTPANLTPYTPGVIARSIAIENGEYVFGHALVLKGGRRYWFYANTPGDFVASFGGSTYAGGDMYVVGMAEQPFRKAESGPGVFVDANFRLRARQ